MTPVWAKYEGADFHCVPLQVLLVYIDQWHCSTWAYPHHGALTAVEDATSIAPSKRRNAGFFVTLTS
ncbi:hypothetical protein BD309DRAFT_969799 [Dichomitus squalens]|nr:hypothetical protein BD309DRAFT_969799 [Dichomitus squalens]